VISRIKKKIVERIAFLRPLRVEAADHDFSSGFKRGLEDIERLVGGDLREREIMVIGCGYRYPDVALFSDKVKRVVGLDVEEIFYRDGFRALYRYHKRNTGSVLKALYVTIALRSGLARYYRRLGTLKGGSIEHEKLEVISYDGLRIPFESDCFDIVISTAVLEHVLDMETFVRELYRVTRPGGIGYHIYHNFYSLSGAHNPKSIYESYPWGHLLGEIEVDPVLLNRIRIDEVKAHFGTQFTFEESHRLDHSHRKSVVGNEFDEEGRELLTEELSRKLTQYPREELLTRAFLIVVKKNGATAELDQDSDNRRAQSATPLP
jgi:SAM-dependent methyltransferase